MIETFRHIDREVFYFINQDLANPVLDLTCLFIRGKSFLLFCYIVIAVSIYRLYPQHFLKIAIAGAITFLLTDQISAHLVKSIFHRIRPCNNVEIHARLIAAYCGGGWSFVSAHATNSFGIATLISVIRPRRQTITILATWASLVAFSQVYVGVHFPADVIGGALLGMAIGGTAGLMLRNFIIHEMA